MRGRFLVVVDDEGVHVFDAGCDSHLEPELNDKVEHPQGEFELLRDPSGPERR